MKQDMKKWVEELKNTKEKKGFLVLSFPAIQKMGITVKELVSSSDLQAEAMKIVADSTPEALASVSMMIFLWRQRRLVLLCVLLMMRFRQLLEVL